MSLACDEPSCIKFATYGINKKATKCNIHRLEYMRYMKPICLFCNNYATYGMSYDVLPTKCKDHRIQQLMTRIDACITICIEKRCNNPAVYKGDHPTAAMYCFKHKKINSVPSRSKCLKCEKPVRTKNKFHCPEHN